MASWSKEVFAKNLRYYKDQKGINQKELANIAGVSAPTMHDWLNANKYPRIDKIEILADYFGILKSDLIEEKRIKENPVKAAELHFEILMDEDIVEMFEEFKRLDKKKRKIIKDLVHSLADEEG